MVNRTLLPPVNRVATLPLKHSGDCSLLGVAPDGTIYAEEMYGQEGWVAQHHLRADGTFMHSVDEAESEGEDLRPLELPAGTITSRTCWKTMPLNFAGPRHRGMRELERAGELVRPLTIQERMGVVQRLKLDVMPPMVLGMAESYVLAESEIIRPDLYFVCRRIRLAYALPEPKFDAEGQPYDYNTEVMYAAHFHDCREETAFEDALTDLADVPLCRPMDCLLAGDHLYIADGGEGERPSAIHVWKLELPAQMSEEEKLLKKLYG